MVAKKYIGQGRSEGTSHEILFRIPFNLDLLKPESIACPFFIDIEQDVVLIKAKRKTFNVCIRIR